MNSRSTIKHSKVKNTAILFEMLVRQVAHTTLSGKEDSPALALIQKYFSPNTELGKELQLYHLLSNTNISLTESKAVQLIDLAVSKRKLLNDKKLTQEKYNLVKEIKNKYDVNNFFDFKVQNYKLFASIYKTFLAETSEFSIKNLDNLVESHLTLTAHLLSPTKFVNKEEMYNLLKEQDEDIRLLSYKILIEKFNSKYNNLDEEQKQLIREYINHVSGTSKFTDYIKTAVPSLKQNLLKNSKLLTDDKVLSIKLTEVAHQLDEIANSKMLRESDIIALMIAYQIKKELNDD